MKKTVLFVALAMFVMGMALWGQSITVNSPGAGDPWCKGQSHQILWSSSGVSGPLSIHLRLASSAPSDPPVLDITASTANDGSHNWTIPASVAPGNYKIRVRTVSTDPFVWDDSESFSIQDCPEEASITVTSPNSTTSWEQETDHDITWNSEGVSGKVHIKLRLASSAPSDPPVLDISTNPLGTFNDGSFHWTIPESVASGQYRIRVRTVSDSPLVYDDSDSFRIGKKFVFPHDWWKKKYMVEIRWPWPPDPDPWRPEWDIREILENIPGDFVGNIVLLKDGKRVQELGTFGRGKTLGNVLSPKLSRLDANAMKNGTAKFSMGIFDSKGNLVQEIQMNNEQKLR